MAPHAFAQQNAFAPKSEGEALRRSGQSASLDDYFDLGAKQTFVQFNAVIEVEGTLEYGSWTDPDTGFVSLLRLRNASFRPV